MLQDAFTCFKRQIQPVKTGVTLLKLIDHAQTLQIVFKATPTGHAVVKGILSGVPKRGMPQIMRQRNGLHQIFIEPERTSDGTAQLRDLQRMRQTGTKQVTFMVQKHLGFVHQAPKSRAVHNAVAVALVFGACQSRFLRKAPAPCSGWVTGVRCEIHSYIKQA
ncbi:hypothetical protein GALL_516950 [mine drainage metagenome]|uniref:Uncharacterized protein n=1 Tax=mine drainage metagenome TaxID=410659 RepID=A0A1J5P6A2_9ZZZZ